ncbi:hypothetical protein [Sphingomonas sp. Leaf62]|uniref:hypothetical protein n=1 Tax=Sphingomonas sp. Leaf62 TaxID=1736228 RepID=UPI0006FDBAB3|nr:hypothetical protein [Sphingomonas sp. Leaf62]KQN78853.1 hypothetical protein ASE91_13230 [Sphingomonas sp. Leaf62]
MIALKSFGFPLSRIAELMAGGLPDLTAFLAGQEKMKTMAREVHEQPAFAGASPSSNAVLDFMAKAYGAAIAVRIMPKPLDMGQRRGRS